MHYAKGAGNCMGYLMPTLISIRSHANPLTVCAPIFYSSSAATPHARPTGADLNVCLLPIPIIYKRDIYHVWGFVKGQV